MKRSVWPAVVVAAGALFPAGGCRNLEKVENFSIPNPTLVRPERPLADVPVPVGFTYKSHGSFVYNGNFRVAKLKYRGTPHVEDCVRYFREQMPQSRWAFVRDSGVDERVVTFHNDAEELNVKLDRSGGITALEIEIKPRPI